jgi:hypothetical protein
MAGLTDEELFGPKGSTGAAKSSSAATQGLTDAELFGTPPQVVPQEPQVPQWEGPIPNPYEAYSDDVTQGFDTSKGMTHTPGQEYPDVGAEMVQGVKDNQSTVGGVVGGIAGIPLGPLGMMAGAALGSGLGSYNQHQDLEKALGEAALSAGIDILTLGIGRLAKPLVTKYIARLRRGESPEKILNEIAKGPIANLGSPQAVAQVQKGLTEKGLTLTPFQTGLASKVEVAKEGVARTGFLSRDVLTDNFDKIKELTRERMAQVLHLNDVGASQISISDVGSGILEAQKEARKALGEVYEAAHDKIYTSASKGTVSLDGTVKKTLDTFKNKNLFDLTDAKTGKSKKELFLEDETIKVINSLEKQMEGVNETGAGYLLQLDQSITGHINRLGQVFSEGGNPKAAMQLVQLKDMMHGTIRKQLKRIDPQAAKDFQKAKTAYGKGLNVIYPDINQTFVTRAKKGDFHAIGSMFTQESKVNNIQAIMKSLDKAYDVIPPNKQLGLTFPSKEQARKGIAKSYVAEAIPKLGDDLDPKQFLRVAEGLARSPSEVARVKAIMGSDYSKYKLAVNTMALAAKKPESGLAVLFQRAKEYASAAAIGAVAVGAGAGIGAIPMAVAVLGMPRVFAHVATNGKHTTALMAISKMDPKKIPYEQIATKMSLLVNDVIEEMYDSGELSSEEHFKLTGGE